MRCRASCFPSPCGRASTTPPSEARCTSRAGSAAIFLTLRRRSRARSRASSDVGANTARGGAVAQARRINRPQVNGSLSFLKTGWGGSHTFRIGGEYMSDRIVAPIDGYGNRCNCVSTLNNGVPTVVQILLGPNVSKNELDDRSGLRRRYVAPDQPDYAVARRPPGSIPARAFQPRKDRQGRSSRRSTPS